MNEARIVQMMIWELERSFQSLMQILSEISKEEAQWLPTTKSKTLETIRQWNTRGDGVGQWNTKGDEWRLAQNFDLLSTIEYLVIHLAQCKLMYDEYAFRKGALTWSDLESPEWSNSRVYLGEAQARFVESLHALSDNQLEETVPTTWMEQRLTKQIIFGLIQHDAYHLGQIRMLRNLYRLYKSSEAHE